MPVGIAEINTAPATRPAGSALDRNLAALELRLPLGQLRRRDGECHVQRPAAVVRRNGATAQADRFARCAAPEDQQHAAIAYRKRAHPVIANQRRETKNLSVEAIRAVEIVDIERRFKNAVES